MRQFILKQQLFWFKKCTLVKRRVGTNGIFIWLFLDIIASILNRLLKPCLFQNSNQDMFTERYIKYYTKEVPYDSPNKYYAIGRNFNASVNQSSYELHMLFVLYLNKKNIFCGNYFVYLTNKYFIDDS